MQFEELNNNELAEVNGGILGGLLGGLLGGNNFGQSASSGALLGGLNLTILSENVDSSGNRSTFGISLGLDNLGRFDSLRNSF
ncbi:MAG: bacteriocin [Nitritalea sp.]